MSEWKRAIVRIWHGTPNRGGEFCGTAFLIAPGYLITAKHVVESLPYQSLYLQGPAWDDGGLYKIDSQIFHEFLDVAILKLKKITNTTHFIVLAPSEQANIVQGTQVTLAGYSTAEAGLETPTLEISAYDGIHDLEVTHTSIAKGMSGGPVLINDRLVGIIRARSQDSTHSYIIRLDAFREFIEPYAVLPDYISKSSPVVSPAVNTHYYQDIITLRREVDKQKRNHQFGQLIREILPWSYRPPISFRNKYEELNAFFEWNGWHFLVETEATEEVLTEKANQWRNFELNVKDRRGQCVGLFCTLFNVANSLFDQANLLNRGGFTAIIIDGNIWDQIIQRGLPLPDYLRYMVLWARSSYKARPDDITEIVSWCYNTSLSNEKIINVCKKVSSTFLRRHKLIRHENIYVTRAIDEDIERQAELLRPSALSVTSKRKRRESHNFIQERQCPKQLFLIKDLSGSGKTTLSVQIALHKKSFFGMARAALEHDIDNLPERLSEIGNDFGLWELTVTNKPIIFSVDSLDEASLAPQKRKEIESLFRFIGELNQLAKENGLLGFPILIVFTVRFDYWRQWESSFEGRQLATFNKRFSFFSPSELDRAISLYASAYQYELPVKIGSDSRQVLSHPFNLLIFSEANEYRGRICTSNILNEDVLSLYFERKKEDIYKRPIPGFSGDIFMLICSRLSIIVAKQAKNILNNEQVKKEIQKSNPLLSNYCEPIFLLLISEQILVRDSENAQQLRFRHMRFIEYLVAFYVTFRLNENKQPEILQQLTNEILSGEFVSLYYVHKFIRFICKSEYPELYTMLTDFYSKSKIYMKRLLSLQRLNISLGLRTSSLEVDTIIKSLNGSDPEMCWESFFVLAAKNNMLDKKIIIQAFEIAWSLNSNRHDRWKLFSKLAIHQLLLEQTVIMKIIENRQPKDWYVFLDGIYEYDMVEEFQEIWKELQGGKLQEIIRNQCGHEWLRVDKIINILLQGEKYDPSKIN